MLIGVFLFLLAVAGSLISQNPSYIESGTMQWLKYLWVLPLIYQFMVDSKAFIELWCLQILLILLCFIVFCGVCDAFTSNSYIGPDLTNICMSTIIAMVSFSFWRKYGSSLVMKILCVLIVVLGFFLAYYVYFHFLAEASVLDYAYAFRSKNSMGQILLCCGYIALANYRPKNLLIRFAYYAIILFMFVVMVLMKSRATIVSGAFVLLYGILKSKNKKLKLTILSLFVLILVVVLLNSELYELIVTGILLANREADDMDDLSSGRVVLISDALESIQENYMVGIGNFYIDCMPIAMILQYGIIGASIVFFLISIFGYHIIRKSHGENHLQKPAFLLFFAFLLNSLFEGYPPFGPGAKCFLMWVMMGFALAEREMKHLQKCK